MKPAQLFALLRLLCLAVLMAGALPAQAQSTCQSRVFNGHEDRVSAAYIAYYGRPADTGGLAYWAGQLAARGGDLDAIIDAFGNSTEYRQRFGGLSNRELIRNLYQQLYGRDPDAGGWAFYEMWLDTKVLSLASIAISIMDGTEGDDVAILNNRKSVARHFITRMESLGAAAPQITDGDLLANLMAAIDASAASRENACAQVNALIDAQASAIPSLTMSAHEAGASGAISNLSGAVNSGRYFKLTVPAGVTNLVIRTFHAAGGMGGVDLYVSRGVRPVPGSADCSSTSFSADEQCSFATPVAGEYFILLRGQIVDYSGVTLSASWRGRGNVNVIETSVDLRDVTLPDGEYALLANNNELPLSPYGGTHTLGLDPAVPNLLAVSNEFNNPVLLGRTQPGQTQADISLASTAEMLVVARLGFAGIEVSNQTLLGQRIRQHALFADLLAAIKTAISRGSPCPLKPECNLLAAQIVEEMVDSLNLSGLLAQSNSANMALAAQNDKDSAATALNGRMSFSLDSKGEATVSNSYLTYYLARAKNMQTGAFTDWKLVEPASKRLKLGSDASKEDWDFWLPSSLDFIMPQFDYKKTSFDLKAFRYGSGASWKDSGLVIQGASILDLVADGYNKKLSKEEDAVAVISLLALNTIQLFDITTSAMKNMADGEIINDSKKAMEIYDGFKKYAGWLSSSKEFSDTFKDYIALTVATLDVIESIVDVNSISEDEDAFGWNVIVTARKSKDILDVLSKAVGFSGGIGTLTDKEREKNIREAFENSLQTSLESAASSGTEALMKAARKEFAEKYKKKDKMKAWILPVQAINEGIEIYLKKLEKEKKDLKKAGKSTEKIEKRIFYFKYGKEAAYFMALVGGGILNRNDFEEMTQPHVFVPMLYKIGKSVLGELLSEKNIHSMIYNLASESGPTARERVQKYAVWKKKALGRFITGLQVGEAVGNRLIPFLWDAAFAENRFDLSVVDGQLSVFGMPKSRVRIAVHRAGSIVKTYDFRSTDTSQSGTVAAQPGDKLTYSVFLEQPELFDINRAPWHLNRAVVPQVVYDVSVNVPNQLYHGMALCVRKWPTLIMNLDFSAQYRQGASFVPENGQCGAGTLLGGNWYESIAGKSFVYKEDKLPPALRLETGGGAVLTGDYVVKSGDKALSVQVFPFRSGNIQHQITLNQPIQATLSVQETGDGFVTLAWSKVPSASSYEIFVSTASSIDPHNPSTYTNRVMSNVPSAKITGLKNGTRYYFGVTAIVGAEATDLSNVVSATPQAQAVASIKLRATPGDGYVDLSWDAVPGATQYDVFQGLSFAGSGESALTWLVATGATSGRVSGLENGVRYGFSISARANKVIVARSGMVSATPQGATTPNLIAGRYLPIEGGSVIRDTVNNLEWQRCSVGQTWDGAAQRCDGTAAKYNWSQATQLTAAGGFRIPTISELKTLVYCSSGTPKQFGPLDDRVECSGSYSKPTIVQAAFPNTTPSSYVWSGSPYAGDSNGAWLVNFGNGNAYDYGNRYSGYYHVRLVRGGQSFAALSARLVTPVPVNAASTWAPASPVASALANLTGYDGTPPNAALNSIRSDASGRGAYFLSRATNLVPGANNGAHHLFHFDAATGQLRNLGAAASGEPGNGDITAFDVAPQVGKLVFRTRATNLESGPGLYLVDLETGTRQPLLTAAQRGGSDPGAENPVLGTSARALAFDAPDAQGQRQVFTAGLDASGLYDLRQETPLDAAVATACCVALSADGRYLAWQETGHDGRMQARVLELATDATATLDWPQGDAAQALRLALSADGAQLHWLAAPLAGQDAAPLHGVANPLFVPTQRLH